MAWQFVEGAAHISPVSAENYICSDCCCWDQCTHTHTHTHPEPENSAMPKSPAW